MCAERTGEVGDTFVAMGISHRGYTKESIVTLKRSVMSGQLVLCVVIL